MTRRWIVLAALVCCWPVLAYAQWASVNAGAALPAACRVGDIYIITSPPTLSHCPVANTWATLTLLTPSAAWGAITGTLSNQTDLQTALNGKISTGGLAGTATTLATPRAINGVNFDGSGAITVTAAAGTLTGTLVATAFPALTGAVTTSAGALATTYAGVVPFALGGIGACAATSATTGTMTVSMTTRCVTITPTGAATFNASGGVAGQTLTFSITTSGTNSFTLTWGTNFRKTGTLATGTTSARFFTVTFLCLDGTTWTEIARTAVQS